MTRFGNRILDPRVVAWAACIPMLLSTAASPARCEILAGAAVRVITPDPLLPVSGGMGPTKPAREKRGDLTARALVLRKGEVTVGVVALDLLGFPSVLGDRVRAKVPRIPGSNVLIGSTHTHSAPDCYALPDGKGGHAGDLAYIDSVCDRAAEALNQALDRLEPARLQVATGEARGKIAYNYYAPDLYDRRMSVIRASTPDGRSIATLVNYAIHPEVLGNDIGILSPDLVGPLCETIEAETGGVALFMNGAQGGMVTADNRLLDQPSDLARGYWKDARSWEECLRIGRLMASEAIRIVAEATPQDDPKLACHSSIVQFPVTSDLMWGAVLGSPLNYPHGDRSISTRLNLVELGDARILTVPGEALPNVGFYLKRKMGGAQNMLFGLTNDAFGYILSRVDFHSFPRYEYISRTSLGEETGEILIEQALKLVEQAGAP
ncbi:hypothetical protein [Paludisphaera soli]|uniref:hypothetical protein n=1 Tax=Paludisphaera soli TaxID=2712865 RepID=UPI001F115A56|nr:hypothetical protein [Paludisphaera soli]